MSGLRWGADAQIGVVNFVLGAILTGMGRETQVALPLMDAGWEARSAKRARCALRTR